MEFTKYTHVERVGKREVDGILNGENLHVSLKIDGTNASVYWKDGSLHAGSRTRELSEENDNAGFYVWTQSNNPEAILLREFCADHPNLIIYGEYTGRNKFVGSIKYYKPEMLNQMWIFDVYDINTEQYLPDAEWRKMLIANGFASWIVPLLGVYDYPTEEELITSLKSVTWGLNGEGKFHEGVVIKSSNYRNPWGRNTYGKIVLSEFQQNKAENKRKKVNVEDVEQYIVDNWLTDAELSKALAKTEVYFDKEFTKTEGKMIGFFLNTCYQAILEEINDIVKKLKNPIIDFSKLNTLIKDRARTFIGL